MVHVPTKSFAFAKAAVINRLQIKNILVDKGKIDRKGVFEGRPLLGGGDQQHSSARPWNGRVDGDMRSNQLTNKKFKCTFQYMYLNLP